MYICTHLTGNDRADLSLENNNLSFKILLLNENDITICYVIFIGIVYMNMRHIAEAISKSSSLLLNNIILYLTQVYIGERIIIIIYLSIVPLLWLVVSNHTYGHNQNDRVLILHFAVYVQ